MPPPFVRPHQATRDPPPPPQITVRMSRHPELNQYITTVLANARPLLLEGAVDRIVCCVYDAAKVPFERYEWRIRSLGGGGTERGGRGGGEPGGESGMGVVEEEEDLLAKTGDELRDLLLRTAGLDWQLQDTPLPSGSSFALLVHTRDDAAGGGGGGADSATATTAALRGGQWLLAEDREHTRPPGGAVEKATPVRSVDVSCMRFQLIRVK